HPESPLFCRQAVETSPPFSTPAGGQVSSLVHLMNAQFLPLSMKTEATLSVYGQLGNHAVVRIPGRRLPGLILQADTVAGFLTQLQEAQACLRSGRAQRADAELDMLVDMLEQWYALIESRLADAGEAL
ncbi:hypothetical protein ORG27_12455, partial [Stenotrophomonas lactitubi]